MLWQLTWIPYPSVCRMYTCALVNNDFHILHVHFTPLMQPPLYALNSPIKKMVWGGELIGLSRSGNPAFCPVQACINRIKYLRTLNAPPTMPLWAFFSIYWQGITTSVLSAELRNAIHVHGSSVGLSPSDISIRSLCSSGAMALLCANVDTDRIRLLGCWRSDEMLRYLHVQAYPVVAHLAPAMLQHGHFSLIQNQPNPQTSILPVHGEH